MGDGADRTGPAPVATGEVVILVGMQGAGKTHYCRRALSGHVRLSQDEGPRTYAGVRRRLGEMLDAGAERIVIDRTNPLASQRREFVRLARARGRRATIVYFDVPRAVCEQRIRQRTTHPTLGEAKMHEAIANFLRHLTVPTADECDELLVVGEDAPPAPRRG